jgi:hypothetical protein
MAGADVRQVGGMHYRVTQAAAAARREAAKTGEWSWSDPYLEQLLRYC